MTSFRLDVSKLNNNISKYKTYRKNCIDELNSVYGNLKNTDAGWNDNNSVPFMNKAKTDKYKLDTYFNEINKLYKEIETLKTGFDNLLVSYRFSRGSILKYNDEYYEKCIRNLNNAISYLNSALSYVNSCNFKATFPQIYKVYTLRSEIKSLKSSISSLINSITSFRNSVNKILSNARNGINKIGKVNLSIDLISYNWKLVNTSIVNNKVDSVASVTAVSTNIGTNLESKSTKSLVQGTVAINQVSDNAIEYNANQFNNNYKVGTNVLVQKAPINNANVSSVYSKSDTGLNQGIIVDSTNQNMISNVGPTVASINRVNSLNVSQNNSINVQNINNYNISSGVTSLGTNNQQDFSDISNN